MIKRKAYLLTCDENSERAIFCKNLLTKIGFDVILFIAIPHENPILSNKLSFLEIYRLISIGDDEWVYVFEDDINIHYEPTLEEIVKYEQISNDKTFFYLGCCITSKLLMNGKILINDDNIGIMDGEQRGSHAMAFAKEKINDLYIYAKESLDEDMDVIHDNYTKNNPTYIMRYDLESYIKGHIGTFYQDRKQFKSLLHNYD